MRIIARSRIGFRSAFTAGEDSILNIRDADGRTVSIVLTDADVALLADTAEICHPHARLLALNGRRLAVTVPTPPRSDKEPEPHEWQPRDQILTFSLPKAA